MLYTIELNSFLYSVSRLLVGTVFQSNCSINLLLNCAYTCNALINGYHCLAVYLEENLGRKHIIKQQPIICSVGTHWASVKHMLSPNACDFPRAVRSFLYSETNYHAIILKFQLSVQFVNVQKKEVFLQSVQNSLEAGQPICQANRLVHRTNWSGFCQLNTICT